MHARSPPLPTCGRPPHGSATGAASRPPSPWPGTEREEGRKRRAAGGVARRSQQRRREGRRRRRSPFRAQAGLTSGCGRGRHSAVPQPGLAAFALKAPRRRRDPRRPAGSAADEASGMVVCPRNTSWGRCRPCRRSHTRTARSSAVCRASAGSPGISDIDVTGARGTVAHAIFRMRRQLGHSGVGASSERLAPSRSQRPMRA